MKKLLLLSILLIINLNATSYHAGSARYKGKSAEVVHEDCVANNIINMGSGAAHDCLMAGLYLSKPTTQRSQKIKKAISPMDAMNNALVKFGDSPLFHILLLTSVFFGISIQKAYYSYIFSLLRK